MSSQESMDLVDSITEWIDQQDQAGSVTDDEIDGVLGLQIQLDAGPWGVRNLAELSGADVATIKAELTQHDSAEFVDWVIDSTLEMHGYQDLIGAEVPPEVATRLAALDADDPDTDPDPDPDTDDPNNGEVRDWQADDDPDHDPDEDDTDDPDPDPDEDDPDDPDPDEDDTDDPDPDPDEDDPDHDLDEDDTDEDDTDEDDTDEDDTDDPDPDADDGEVRVWRADDDPDHDLDEDDTDADFDGDEGPDDAGAHDLAGHTSEEAADEDIDDEDIDEPDDEDIDDEDIDEPDDEDIDEPDDEDIDEPDDEDIDEPDDEDIDDDLDDDDLEDDDGLDDEDDGLDDGDDGLEEPDWVDDQDNDTDENDGLDDEEDSDGPELGALRFFDGPDALGPSFLDPVEPTTLSRIRPIAAWALVAAAFALFIVAGIQLIQNIEREPQVAGGAEAEATAAPEETPTPEPTATTIPAAAAAAEPAEGEEPPEPSSIALIRTVDGHVHSIVMFEDSVDQARLVHDGADDDAGVNIAVVNNGVAVIEADGDVHTAMFRENGRPRALDPVWDGEALTPATGFAQSQEQFLALDSDGSIHAFPAGEPATEESVETVWDAAEQGSRATSIAAQSDLVPFVRADGNANMVVSSAENQIVGIWSTEVGDGTPDDTAPPPAYNLATSPVGILLGVGQGAVARYNLGEFEGPQVVAMWVPNEARGLSGAISYSPAGRGAAIVTADGDVVLVDDTGSGPHVWDHADSGLRALGVAATDNDMLILLESGTVLRINNTGNTESLGSIWDVTDETISPAAQVLLLDLG